MQENYIKQHSITSLFEGAFTIIPKIWKELLICAAPYVLYVVVSHLLSSFAFQEQAILLAEVNQANLAGHTDRVAYLMRDLSSFLVGSIAVGIVFALINFVFTSTGIRIAYKAYRNESFDLKEELLFVLKNALGKAVLIVLILIGLGLAGLIALLIAAAILGIISPIVSTVITSVAILFAIIYLPIKLIFTMQVLLIDEEDSFDCIKTSMKIVKGRWPRTLGIALLAGIAVFLLTSLLTAPFSGPFYNELLIFMDNYIGNIQNGDMMRAINALQDFIQQTQYLLITPLTISFVLSYIFETCFFTLFFIDNKIRAGMLTSPDLSTTDVEDIRTEALIDDNEDDFQ